MSEKKFQHLCFSSVSSSYFSRLGRFSSFDLISGSVIESRCSVLRLTDSKGPFPLLLPC